MPELVKQNKPNRYFYAYTLGKHASLSWTPITCFMFEFLLESSPQMFHTASNWLTLVLALQRYVYVCHPGLAKQICTVRKTRVVVIMVMGMAVMQMLPRIFDRSYSVETTGSQDFVNFIVNQLESIYFRFPF